jgi:hypothetical protein
MAAFIRSVIQGLSGFAVFLFLIVATLHDSAGS